MSGAAIAARGLEKRFGRTAALRELDLDVGAGARFAVLGPNGAGKTTLLRLLAGLSRPSAGQLEVDGRPAAHRESRARVGYLGHATLLSPSLSARENLIFAARLYSCPDPRGRADALVGEEGLEAFAERPAGDLSRGQAQRVAIARAIVHEPDLMLLDEPFTGLDRRAAERLAGCLARLCERGCTTILVTHGVEHAYRLADTVLVLARGREVWRGGLAEGDTATLEAALDRAAEGEAPAA